MLVKLNCSSNYFIQINPHFLVLQESPAKDSFLLFKFPKLTCSDTEPSSWLAIYLFSCAPVSQQVYLVVSV